MPPIEKSQFKRCVLFVSHPFGNSEIRLSWCKTMRVNFRKWKDKPKRLNKPSGSLPGDIHFCGLTLLFLVPPALHSPQPTLFIGPRYFTHQPKMPSLLLALTLTFSYTRFYMILFSLLQKLPFTNLLQFNQASVTWRSAFKNRKSNDNKNLMNTYVYQAYF